MAEIYKLRRARFPSQAAPCLERLAEHAKKGTVTGVAFICLIEGGGFIADTCGDASTRPDDVRELLRALDAKVAKRQLRSR